MRLISLIALTSLLSALQGILPTAAPAAGRLKVNGSLELRETYDTNVFLLRRGMVDDFITTIHPALNFSYRGNRINFDAENSAIFFLYGGNSELDDQFFDQRSLLEYKLGPRLSIEAENLYTSVRETIGKPSDLSSNLVQSDSWDVGPVYRTALGSRSRGEFRASYGRTMYFNAGVDSGELPEFGDARASIYLDRDLSERILVYTSQEFTRRDFSDRGDLGFSGVLSQFGLRWRFGRRFSLDLSGGYNWLSFDDLGNEGGSFVDTALHYTPNFRTSISTAYTQLFTTDIFGNVFRQNRLSIAMDRNISARTLLKFNSFISFFDQAGTVSPDNKYLGGNLRFEHKVRRRLTFLADVGWRQNGGSLNIDDYEDLRTTVGLRYEF